MGIRIRKASELEIPDNIEITQPSLCEHITAKSSNQLLIRPLAIYEIPKEKILKKL